MLWPAHPPCQNGNRNLIDTDVWLVPVIEFS